jgi:hypothetical protein
MQFIRNFISFRNITTTSTILLESQPRTARAACCLAAMPPLHFRDVRLFVDGYRVKQLLVASLGAEQFWRLAFHERRGMDSLKWSEVQTVEVRNVVRKDGVGADARVKKMRSVQVHLRRGDSELALRVAHGVVRLVEERGYRILDAVVPQLDEAGTCVGEHDLVCERRIQPTGVTGLSSFEIKLRLVYAPKTLVKARHQIQTLSWKLWPAAKADSTRVWAERVCVLLRWDGCDAFDVGDTWAATYAEAMPVGAEKDAPDNWCVLWGWKGRLLTVQEAKAAAQATAMAKKSKDAEAKARAKVQLTIERLWAKCRRSKKQGKEMRSVADMLRDVHTVKCKKVKANLHHRLPGWARKWRWPVNSYDKDESAKSSTGGGCNGFVATFEAMCDIYKCVS